MTLAELNLPMRRDFLQVNFMEESMSQNEAYFCREMRLNLRRIRKTSIQHSNFMVEYGETALRIASFFAGYCHIEEMITWINKS